jgi:hypothetical protein
MTNKKGKGNNSNSNSNSNSGFPSGMTTGTVRVRELWGRG